MFSLAFELITLPDRGEEGEGRAEAFVPRASIRIPSIPLSSPVEKVSLVLPAIRPLATNQLLSMKGCVANHRTTCGFVTED